MTKYGIQVSQSGVPINRAADYQKVLDSDWRALEVYQEKKIPAIANKANNTYEYRKIVSHDLGFIPAFETGVLAVDDGFGSLVVPDVVATDKAIYILLDHGSSRPAYLQQIFWVRIYKYPITEDYTAPNAPTTSKSGPDTKYGLKMTDPNYNGHASDYATYKFTVNTKAKALNVHRSGILLNSQNPRNANVTFPSFYGTNEIAVDHSLGYNPTFYLARVYHWEEQFGSIQTQFISTFGKPNYVVGPIDTFGLNIRGFSDERYIGWKGVQSTFYNDAAFILLKDPVEIIG